MLEANHDEEMLKKAIYPYALKQRILGTRGHLSNKAAGWLLSQMERLPGEVILAHLSQETTRRSLRLKRCAEFWMQEKPAGIRKYM